MRRIVIPILAFLLLLSFCGCDGQSTGSQPSATQATSPSTTAPTTTPKPQINQQPMFAASMPIVKENFTSDSGDVVLQHIYNKNLELIVPDQDVADAVIIDYLNRTDKWHAAADELYTDATSAHASGNLQEGYILKTTFTPTRLDRGVFSLLGYSAALKGQAHPEVTYESVTYDLTTGEVLTFTDIIRPEADLQRLQELILSSLKEQEDKITLYEGYESTVTKLFEHPTNWLFSDYGLVFHYSPYEIAPYSSGVITAIIEYNKLGNILNDAYFPGETDEYNGKLLIKPLDIDKMNQFTQIAEVVCSHDSKQYILYTDSLIKNLRIEQIDDNAKYTVFVSQYVSPGDGIAIYASKEQNFNIYYTENGEFVWKTLHITADGTPQLSK